MTHSKNSNDKADDAKCFIGYISETSFKGINSQQQEQLKSVLYAVADLIPSSVDETTNLTQVKKNLSSVSVITSKGTELIRKSDSEQLSTCIERGLGRAAKRLNDLEDNAWGNVSIDASLEDGLSKARDKVIESYLIRTQYYFKRADAAGSKAAIDNCLTMRQLSSRGINQEFELDRTLISQCFNAINDRSQLPQAALYLKNISQEIQPSEINVENEDRAIEMVKTLTQIAKMPAETNMASAIVSSARDILYQLNIGASTNNLIKLKREANASLQMINELTGLADAPDIQPTMRLDVYVTQITEIVEALNAHRRSMDRLGICSDLNIVINYHRLARKLQEEQWHQLVRVPALPEVKSLQRHLGQYFKEADIALTALQQQDKALTRQSQSKADTDFSACLADLRTLKKIVSDHPR